MGFDYGSLGANISDMLLDLFPNPDGADYALRDLSSTYLGPVVRVRRSSDNAERDFYASELVDYEYLSEELVTNGGFDDDSGWSISGESSISSGQGRIYSSAGAFSRIGQDILSVGKIYLTEFETVDNTDPPAQLLIGAGNTVLAFSDLGSYRRVDLADGATGELLFIRSGITDISIDNISVREYSPSTLETWVGAGNQGYVVTLYDQSVSYGADVVVNGDFEDGITGWTPNQLAGELTTLSVVIGRLEVDTTAVGGAYQEILAEVGNAYSLSFKREDGTISSSARIYPEGGFSGAFLESQNDDIVFEALSINPRIYIRNTGDGVSYWDNISVRELSKLPNNATQSIASYQPLIVENGATVLENGKPAIKFDGVDDYLVTNVIPPPTATLIAVARGDTANRMVIGARDSTDERSYLGIDSSENLWTGVASQYVSGNSLLLGSQNLLSLSYNGTTILGHVNGVEEVNAPQLESVDNTTTGYAIGGGLLPSLDFPWEGTSQEIHIYPSDQSANRTGIETNINENYEIY